jgi:hypothetical protein
LIEESLSINAFALSVAVLQGTLTNLVSLEALSTIETITPYAELL